MEGLIADGNFEQLLAFCDEHELQLANTDQTPAYSVHLLAYLIQHDLDNARFLWKRIPAAIKKTDHQLAAVWEIAKCLWTRDYICVYPAFQAHSWDPLHQTLVAQLAAGFRKRTVDLVSRAYQAISADNLATFLGCSPDDATKFAESQGWTKEGDFIAPTPTDDSKVVLGTSANLQSLSEYVVYLETDLSVPPKATEKSAKSPNVAPKGSAGHSKGHAK